MARQISMATRKELIAAVGARYRTGNKADRGKILDEFIGLTGYHRKHAIRVLVNEPRSGPRKRSYSGLYGEALRRALIIVWEVSDRLCGKRLRALIPTLIAAMERHGRLALDAEVRQRLLRVSAATIDRILLPMREKANGHRKRRPGVGSAIRRSVRVRTFSDWGDPVPGYFETDLVEHCGGPKYDGNFVHSLVMTDIATGWTECLALVVREQSLIVEGFTTAQSLLPFPIRGLDADNDGAFMNETVVNFCTDNAIELTRSRAYRKNDQAWVEQKNGAVVRRLVGYGRLSGMAATRALAQLYAVARLYINFFQPSFKLKSKVRDGARVIKTYHPPMTPSDRLLQAPSVDQATKTRVRAQLLELDPVQLLQQIRVAQENLGAIAARGTAPAEPTSAAGVEGFLASLAEAWRSGEVRPTHRKKARAPRAWRTRVDPFEHTWPTLEHWLETDPGTSAKDLLARLTEMYPDLYRGTVQLRTLQRRVREWRSERAMTLVLRATQASSG
ncbi:MAG: transposase family protein [Betaproteobacteria bacterium]|nr:transposase family protein [Betaproteobacteria bacterium]